MNHLKIKKQVIEAPGIRTLDWIQGMVVDWNSAGNQYSLNGETNKLHKYHFGFVCDGSLSSECGEYVFIYQKLGTKGLLLKNGELLREINRSYYQSAVYEFPAAFLTHKERTYLVHCPIQYCQLDIEDVETGEIITNVKGRDPQDVFHSRLETSPDNKHLLSKGWYWHPFNGIELFNIENCFADPLLLDEGTSPAKVTTEICSASFINSSEILICSMNEEPSEEEELLPPGHLAVWNIEANEIKNAVKIKGPFGNVFAIDAKKCWDLFEYPKIISLENGEVLAEDKSVFSGKQCSSIIHHLEKLPKIAFNHKTKQIAMAYDNKIEILTL